MHYSQRPPKDYPRPDVPLFFSQDMAMWNLLWLFYPRMDQLEELRAEPGEEKSYRPLADWLNAFDADLSAAISLDLEQDSRGLREQVTTLPPVRFMDWLWKQDFTHLHLYSHVGMEGMHLAMKRAQWLDQEAGNPSSAQVIALDFKRRT